MSPQQLVEDEHDLQFCVGIRAVALDEKDFSPHSIEVWRTKTTMSFFHTIPAALQASKLVVVNDDSSYMRLTGTDRIVTMMKNMETEMHKLKGAIASLKSIVLNLIKFTRAGAFQETLLQCVCKAVEPLMQKYNFVQASGGGASIEEISALFDRHNNNLEAMQAQADALTPQDSGASPNNDIIEWRVRVGDESSRVVAVPPGHELVNAELCDAIKWRERG